MQMPVRDQYNVEGSGNSSKNISGEFFFLSYAWTKTWADLPSRRDVSLVAALGNAQRALLAFPFPGKIQSG